MRWVQEGSEGYISTATFKPSRHHELDWCYNSRNYPMDVAKCGRCDGDNCPGVKVHHIAKLLKWVDMSGWQIHSWRGELPAHPWRCLCAYICPVGRSHTTGAHDADVEGSVETPTTRWFATVSLSSPQAPRLDSAGTCRTTPKYPAKRRSGVI
jgi:hypothetical protein